MRTTVRLLLSSVTYSLSAEPEGVVESPFVVADMTTNVRDRLADYFSKNGEMCEKTEKFLSAMLKLPNWGAFHTIPFGVFQK